MNLQNLQYFSVMAEIEHYTRAAEKLHITQPALSHAIHQLEEQIGVPLFEKKGKRVVLTRYGELFRQEITPVLEQLDFATKKINLIRQGYDMIRVGFPPLLGMTFLPQKMRRFKEQMHYQDIHFQPIELNSHLLYDTLRSDKCDLIIATKLEEDPALRYAPVLRLPLKAIVSKEHPLAERKSISLEEIAREPFIAFSQKSGLRSAVDGLFQRAGVEPNIIGEIMQDRVVAGFVAQNFGVSIVEDIPILPILPVSMIPLETEDAWLIFYAVWRDESGYSKHVLDFLNYLVRQYEPLPDVNL